ncbi:MAG TPA: 16S rRNA (cytidine(1402)-2'-O)-methyltransferase [Streptosporangiaceae bacterium]
MNSGFHQGDDPGQTETGTLILAAAPIGRPQDASGSLAVALAAAPVIAAEDTRRLMRLARALGVTLAGRVVSYYEAVETERARVLLNALADGQDVLLITDAGTPGISDPGYRLVNTAIEAGVRVTVLPGPSAVTAALAVSGLPSDRFCFEGFPPRRANALARRLADLRDEPRTMVFFESPRRLPATLKQMAAAFGADRPAAVCRELTKTHEQIKRAPLGELVTWAADGVLGEITVVVGGAISTGASAAAPGTQDIAAKVRAAEQAGLTRKEAMVSVAAETGLARRTVYDAMIKAKPDQPP